MLRTDVKTQAYRIDTGLLSKDALRDVGCKAIGHSAQALVDAMFKTASQRSQIVGPEQFTDAPLVSFTVNGDAYDAKACS